jgi:hypothetical protein
MPERGSTRHSARVDEELEREVESLTRGAPVEARAEEWRQMEPAAEGEPNPDGITSVNDVELRSLLAVSLRPSAFPGDRARMLEVAREEHAEDRVLAWLESLPNDEQFETVQSVWEALGGGYESRDAPDLGSDPQIAVPIATPPAPRDAVETPAAPAPASAEDESASPSLIGRVVGIAFAGVSLAAGVAAEAVRVVRRRF